MKALHTGLVRYVITCFAIAAGLAAPAHAGVLPEDRADALYFRYDGGGVVINGPSVLLRKSIGEHVSVSANSLRRHGVLRVHRRGDFGEPV